MVSISKIVFVGWRGSGQFCFLMFSSATLSSSAPGSEVIKGFSGSTQLSMKFKMLMDIEIAKIDEIFSFISPKPVIYPVNKC